MMPEHITISESTLIKVGYGILFGIVVLDSNTNVVIEAFDSQESNLNQRILQEFYVKPGDSHRRISCGLTERGKKFDVGLFVDPKGLKIEVYYK